MDNARCEASRILRPKKGKYLKTKSIYLKQTAGKKY
jgi:hypothetical protein